MGLELFSLSGKRALITGGSRGLGYVLAAGLGGCGAEVILNARDAARLAAAVAELEGQGIVAHSAAFDVTDAAAGAAAVARIEAAIGPIDILVNNAGIQQRGPLESFPAEAWGRIMETNLSSAFYVGQAVAGGMIARGRGKIINMGSMQCEVGRPGIAPYTAAKGGLKMLTKAMAVEWGGHNIQVNGIGPGYFKTDMTAALVADEAFNGWVCKRTPAGRWGDPSELIGAAVYLASGASDYVNGTMIYVDGGMLAGV